jgi:hypothetical protein
MGSVRVINEFTFYLEKAQTRGKKIVAKNERARDAVGIQLRVPLGSAADNFVSTDFEKKSMFHLLETLIIAQCFKTNKF